MCLGETAQITKFKNKIKLIEYENELQKTIISQLKSLHISSTQVKFSRCCHYACKINHAKHNFVSVKQSPKPNLVKTTATRQTTQKEDNFIIKCQRAVEKFQNVYGYPQPPAMVKIKSFDSINDLVLIGKIISES